MVGGKLKVMAVRSFPQVALKNLLVPYRAPVSMTFEWQLVPMPFLTSAGLLQA